MYPRSDASFTVFLTQSFKQMKRLKIKSFQSNFKNLRPNVTDDFPEFCQFISWKSWTRRSVYKMQHFLLRTSFPLSSEEAANISFQSDWFDVKIWCAMNEEMLIIHHFDLLCPVGLQAVKTFSNEARIKRTHILYLSEVVSKGWSAKEWDGKFWSLKEVVDCTAYGS